MFEKVSGAIGKFDDVIVIDSEFDILRPETSGENSEMLRQAAFRQNINIEAVRQFFMTDRFLNLVVKLSVHCSPPVSSPVR